MKKILLVDPFYNNGNVPPNYSLGEIESSLCDSFEIKVLDFVYKNEIDSLDEFKRIEQSYFEEIREKLFEYEPNIIYITTSYGIPLKQCPVYPRVKKIVEIINEVGNFDIYIGGATVNFGKKELNIEPNSEKNVTFIFGDEINFVKEVEHKYNCKVKNDIIKWNSWDLSKYPKHISLLSAKGCPSACSFCFENKIFDYKYSVKEIKEFIENIEYFYNLGYKKFAIEDSSFFFNRNIEYFCDYLIEKNIDIDWTCYGKIFQIINNSKLLPKLKKAGCTSMIIGIETFDDDYLTEINKGIIKDDTMKALRLLKDNHIEVQGCFMLGINNQSLESIKNNIDYAISLKLFKYRWHIYQRNLHQLKEVYGEINESDYFTLQLNVPDNCLDDMLSNCEKPILLLNEEHFLIRGTHYIKKDNINFKNYRIGNTTYKKIVEVLSEKFIGYNFNEESMYNDI